MVAESFEGCVLMSISPASAPTANVFAGVTRNRARSGWSRAKVPATSQAYGLRRAWHADRVVASGETTEYSCHCPAPASASAAATLAFFRKVSSARLV
jgi:hypothetical protein